MAILSKDDLLSLLNGNSREILSLMSETSLLRDEDIITYSKNVFLPLTDICRNTCGYCTFRKDPKSDQAKILMKPDEIRGIIEKANSFNCKEALFTFGEKPDETDSVMSCLEDSWIYRDVRIFILHLRGYTEKFRTFTTQQPWNT